MPVKFSAGTSILPPGLDLTPAKLRLLEAALEPFGDRGYHAISIRDIAESLGQQPSAIYFHYPSKLDLLFELVCIGHRYHHEALRAALLDVGRDPADQLAAVVHAHVRVHLEYPAMARLTNRELRSLSPELLRTAVQIRDQSEQIFIEVIERGVRLGRFNASVDPFLASKAIGAMGIRLPEWRTAGTPRTPKQILESYTNFALRLVGAAPDHEDANV